jgi:hypothetical protein
MPQDAETIANYSNPAFVPGGWAPIIESERAREAFIRTQY